MRRVVGLVMMVDSVLLALDLSRYVERLARRSVPYQTLFAAHAVVGAGMLVAGTMLFSRRDARAESGLAGLNGTGSAPLNVPPVKASCFLLAAAFALAVVETTEYNWSDTVIRGVYTVVMVALLIRKTTLPTT